MLAYGGTGQSVAYTLSAQQAQARVYISPLVLSSEFCLQNLIPFFSPFGEILTLVSVVLVEIF